MRKSLLAAVLFALIAIIAVTAIDPDRHAVSQPLDPSDDPFERAIFGYNRPSSQPPDSEANAAWAKCIMSNLDKVLTEKSAILLARACRI